MIKKIKIYQIIAAYAIFVTLFFCVQSYRGNIVFDSGGTSIKGQAYGSHK